MKKLAKISLVALLVAIVIVGCVKVTVKLDLTTTSLNLTIGTIPTGQINATVNPADATINYTSEDTSVATVDSNGLVTAVAAGTTRIEVQGTKDGANPSEKKYVDVTVNPQPQVDFTVNPDNLTLTLVLNPDGVLTVSGLTEGAVLSKVDPACVVSEIVGNTIEVEAVSVGTGEIAITGTKDGYISKTVNVSVTVLPQPSVEIAAENLAMMVGDSEEAPVTIIGPIGVLVDLEFTSDAPAVADVDVDGFVDALAEGEAVITVVASAEGYISDTASFTVFVGQYDAPEVEAELLGDDGFLLVDDATCYIDELLMYVTPYDFVLELDNFTIQAMTIGGVPLGDPIVRNFPVSGSAYPVLIGVEDIFEDPEDAEAGIYVFEVTAENEAGLVSEPVFVPFFVKLTKSDILDAWISDSELFDVFWDGDRYYVGNNESLDIDLLFTNDSVVDILAVLVEGDQTSSSLEDLCGCGILGSYGPILDVNLDGEEPVVEVTLDDFDITGAATEGEYTIAIILYDEECGDESPLCNPCSVNDYAYILIERESEPEIVCDYDCNPCEPCSTGDWKVVGEITGLATDNLGYFSVQLAIDDWIYFATPENIEYIGGGVAAVTFVLDENVTPEPYPNATEYEFFIETVTGYADQSGICEMDIDFIPPAIETEGFDCMNSAELIAADGLATMYATITDDWGIQKVVVDYEQFGYPTLTPTVTIDGDNVSQKEFGPGKFEVLAKIEFAFDPATATNYEWVGTGIFWAEDNLCNASEEIAIGTVDTVPPVVELGLDCIIGPCEVDCDAEFADIKWFIDDINYRIAVIEINYGELDSSDLVEIDEGVYETLNQDIYGTARWYFEEFGCGDLVATITVFDECDNFAIDVFTIEDMDNVDPEIYDFILEPIDPCVDDSVQFEWCAYDCCPTPTVYMVTSKSGTITSHTEGVEFTKVPCNQEVITEENFDIDGIYFSEWTLWEVTSATPSLLYEVEGEWEFGRVICEDLFAVLLIDDCCVEPYRECALRTGPDGGFVWELEETVEITNAAPREGEGLDNDFRLELLSVNNLLAFQGEEILEIDQSPFVELEPNATCAKIWVRWKECLDWEVEVNYQSAICGHPEPGVVSPWTFDEDDLEREFYGFYGENRWGYIRICLPEIECDDLIATMTVWDPCEREVDYVASKTLDNVPPEAALTWLEAPACQDATATLQYFFEDGCNATATIDISWLNDVHDYGSEDSTTISVKGTGEYQVIIPYGEYEVNATMTVVDEGGNEVVKTVESVWNDDEPPAVYDYEYTQVASLVVFTFHATDLTGLYTPELYVNGVSQIVSGPVGRTYTATYTNACIYGETFEASLVVTDKCENVASGTMPLEEIEDNVNPPSLTVDWGNPASDATSVEISWDFLKCDIPGNPKGYILEFVTGPNSEIAPWYKEIPAASTTAQGTALWSFEGLQTKDIFATATAYVECTIEASVVDATHTTIDNASPTVKGVQMVVPSEDSTPCKFLISFGEPLDTSVLTPNATLFRDGEPLAQVKAGIYGNAVYSTPLGGPSNSVVELEFDAECNLGNQYYIELADITSGLSGLIMAPDTLGPITPILPYINNK